MADLFLLNNWCFRLFFSFFVAGYSVVIIPLGCSAEDTEKTLEGNLINLYDQLNHSKINGRAAGLVKNPKKFEAKEILSLDFENDSFAPLTIRAGEKHLVSLVADDSSDRGSVLKLRGSQKRLPIINSPAVPVKSELTYKLQYKISTRMVPFLPLKKSWQAKAVLYRLTEDESSDPGLALSDPKREEEARLEEPKSFGVPVYYDNKPWKSVEDTFWVPPEATHMVLKFGFGPASNASSRFSPRASVQFDNIKLTALSKIVHKRFKSNQNRDTSKHALKMSVPLSHRNRHSALDLRYSIYAPAPSELNYKVKVPASGILSFGYGMLPETADLTSGRKVFFEVFADQRRIFSDNPAFGRKDVCIWKNADLSLEEFVGKEIRLRFITRAENSLEKEELKFPSAGMAWSMPVLYNKRSKNKIVVLFVIDALPATATSLYGYPTDTTPNLKRIAEEGVIFSRALAPSGWTLPSFSSFLTGIDVVEHRAGEADNSNALGKVPLESRFDTLAENLRAGGWETMAWVNNPYLTTPSGLHQGFSRYYDYGSRSFVNAAKEGVEEFLERVEHSRGRKQFLMIHLLDPHAPYLPNEEFKQRFKAKGKVGRVAENNSFPIFSDLVSNRIKLTVEEKKHYRRFYDAVVGYADDHLGKVFDVVKEKLDRDQLLFIITSDHGEEFWEHGYYEHAQSLYGELLHVPLVMYGNGKTGRVNEAVSITDLPPTILDYAGIRSGEKIEGSFLDCLVGCDKEHSNRVHVSSGTTWGFERYSVETKGLKYIYNSMGAGYKSSRSKMPEGIFELYDIDKDPGEKKNIIEDNLEQAEDLHAELVRRVLRSTRSGYLIYFDAGKNAEKAPRLSARLISPAGNSWKGRVEDFIWPIADNQASRSEDLFKKTVSGINLIVKLTSRRALVKFSLKNNKKSQIPVEITLDGKPARLDWIKIGKGLEEPLKMPFNMEEKVYQKQVEDSLIESLLRRDSAEPLIVIFPLGDTETEEQETDVDADPNSHELQEQLKSLGYVG